MGGEEGGVGWGVNGEGDPKRKDGANHEDLVPWLCGLGGFGVVNV